MQYAATMLACANPDLGLASWTEGAMQRSVMRTAKIRLKVIKNLGMELVGLNSRDFRDPAHRFKVQPLPAKYTYITTVSAMVAP